MILKPARDTDIVERAKVGLLVQARIGRRIRGGLVYKSMCVQDIARGHVYGNSPRNVIACAYPELQP